MSNNQVQELLSNVMQNDSAIKSALSNKADVADVKEMINNEQFRKQVAGAISDPNILEKANGLLDNLAKMSQVGGRRKKKSFKKHYMWNTKGKRYLAKTYKQHLKGVKLGHTHKKPKKKKTKKKALRKKRKTKKRRRRR